MVGLVPKKEFKTTLSMDFFRLMCGDRLGYGMSRSVYALSSDPNLVIKFETVAGQFQNVHEFELWQRYMDHEPVRKWLAPIDSISANGSILLMKRTMPISFDQFPDEVPGFLGDIKLGNFGMFEGRVVCHDYGTGLFENPRRGMKKVIKKDGQVWAK